MNHDPNAPVIVAVSQKTWREPDAQRAPIDALYEVANDALASLQCPALLEDIDQLATVRFIMDSDPNLAPLLPRNPGQVLAQKLGLGDTKHFQTSLGGNTPQFLVNHFAARLASGEARAVLISGAELLNTFFDSLRNGNDISHWAGDACEPPIMLGEEKDGTSELEKAHGLYEPINTYPLFEQALRHANGGTPEQQQQFSAEICSRMSAVAAANPHAWKQNAQSTEEIAKATERNRYIGFPYTKSMNALLSVDMAAAVVMTTAGRAMELGLDPASLIYLRAGADVNEIWNFSERPELHRAPAIGIAARACLEQAGITLDEVSKFDIYSCFPCAVQVACDEIGLSPLDQREITVTGGLPFFGGPGNNYSLHAIAEMVEQLRAARGHGLVTANGWYLTKHSIGVYSTEPGSHSWNAVDSNMLQEQVDQAPRRKLASTAEGPATIESYTVSFDRNGPTKGFVIGLNDRQERIIANVAAGTDTLSRLIEDELIGARGAVSSVGGTNQFEL